MKITLKIEQDYDYQESQQMMINGETKWSARDLAMDCPEDATLSRDMTNGNEIIELMKLAFEAGKNNEEFDVEITTN